MARAVRILVKLVCQECGHSWRVSPSACPYCPKCNSADYEVVETNG